MSPLPQHPSPGPPGDAVETIYITRKGALYPFQTFASSRWVIKEIFQRGEYGLLHVPGFRPETIVDIGANVGAYALFAAVHFPAARLICFEPVAGNFELLTHNLRAVERAELHNFGLHDHDARVPIYYGRNNAGECSIHRGPEQREGSEEITLKRASQVLAQAGVDRISILKIDTEGCELPILRDLESWLARTDFVLLEFHHDDDRRAIDQLLAERFLLFGGRIDRPHTGVLKYVSRTILPATRPTGAVP